MNGSRIVQLAVFAIVVFGSVEAAFADIAYSFTGFFVISSMKENPGAKYWRLTGPAGHVGWH
jgi:hypothetical protein